MTGEINITGNPNSGMVFGTVGSYFLKEGDWVTVTKDISIPPVLVELFDGCNVRDMGSSAITITVNADAGSLLTGTLTQTVVKGVATFSDLKFCAPSVTKLTFMAGAQGNTRATSIQRYRHFQQQPLLQRGEKKLRDKDRYIPLVKIDMLDSSNMADITDNTVEITATCAEVSLTGITAKMTNGTATFTNLKIDSCGAPNGVFRLTFMAGVSETSPVRGKSLVSTSGWKECKTPTSKQPLVGCPHHPPLFCFPTCPASACGATTVAEWGRSFPRSSRPLPRTGLC